MLAVKNFSPDIIILDDGFQHRKLFRDFDILLLDSKRPFGNGRLLPSGVLREPVSSIKRADAFVLTRSSPDSAGGKDAVREVSDRQPVFEAYSEAYFFAAVKKSPGDPAAAFRTAVSRDFSLFAGKKIVAFSGIAGNEGFRKTLSGYGCDIVEFFGFPDHHPYSKKDIGRISSAAKEKKAEFIMTTEKDFARMGGGFDLPADLVVVGVEMCLKDENSFYEYLNTHCQGLHK
jgi:tetraacyldisaccharide 4'-kinase